jgi:hypothetical protein
MIKNNSEIGQKVTNDIIKITGMNKLSTRMICNIIKQQE